MFSPFTAVVVDDIDYFNLGTIKLFLNTMILRLPVNNLLHSALCIALSPHPTLFSFYCIDLLLLDLLSYPKNLKILFFYLVCHDMQSCEFSSLKFLAYFVCHVQNFSYCENCRAQFCNMRRVTHRPRTSFSPICHCLLAYHFDEILLYTLRLHALFLTKLQDFNCFRVLFFVFLCVCVCVLESRA